MQRRYRNVRIVGVDAVSSIAVTRSVRILPVSESPSFIPLSCHANAVGYVSCEPWDGLETAAGFHEDQFLAEQEIATPSARFAASGEFPGSKAMFSATYSFQSYWRVSTDGLERRFSSSAGRSLAKFK
jgi:hypothetical protein